MRILSVEVSFTDLDTGEPALSHFKAALESGKHVVTTNKGPILLAYNELKQLADAKGLHLGFEGTVVSGTPIFGLAESCLQGNEVTEIKGILNGTTNYILCEMEKGLDYDTSTQTGPGSRLRRGRARQRCAGLRRARQNQLSSPTL